jgi:hypothetical protein
LAQGVVGLLNKPRSKAKVIMLGELAANRALDQLDPIE